MISCPYCSKRLEDSEAFCIRCGFIHPIFLSGFISTEVDRSTMLEIGGRLLPNGISSLKEVPNRNQLASRLVAMVIDANEYAGLVELCSVRNRTEWIILLDRLARLVDPDNPLPVTCWNRGVGMAMLQTKLRQAFSTEELRRFCYDHPGWRPVYEQIAESTGKGELLTLVMKFAANDVAVRVTDLFNYLKKENSLRWYELIDEQFSGMEPTFF